MRNWTSHARQHTGYALEVRGGRCPLERRVLPDCPVRPTSFRSALIGGQRNGFMGANKGRHACVDCLSPRVVALVIWVTTASALDALFTPLRLAEGFGEANPFMAMVLAYDIEAFVIVKMAVAASGSSILAAHQQYLLANRGLCGLALIYLGVLAFHGMLILGSG